MHKEMAVLKDINFQKNRKLVLGQEKRRIFFQQLEADCIWLESHGVMDYSLLLLIHKCELSVEVKPSVSSSSTTTKPTAFASLNALGSSATSPGGQEPRAIAARSSATASAPDPLYPNLRTLVPGEGDTSR